MEQKTTIDQCKNCGKDFKKIQNKKFCTIECGKLYHKNKYYLERYGEIKDISEDGICIICKKSFKRKNNQQCFCSQACIRRKRRNLEITKALNREYFLEKFNFTCQDCGSENNGNLELHHIMPLYKGGSDSSDNITCLCDVCHKKIHKIID